MEQLFYLSLVGNAVLIIVLIVLISKRTAQPQQTKKQSNKVLNEQQKGTTQSQIERRKQSSTQFYNKSIDDVAAFIKQSDWKSILNNVDNFVPRAGSQHDEQIWKMLTDRLCQTEHPILSDKFVNKHSSEIIWVETLAIDEEIKKSVVDKWNITPKIPAYVLRKNRQLVGFALSSNLIIDGVTPRGVFASHIRKIVESWGKLLLTQTDSEFVEKNFDTLNLMMEEADVPQISHKNWMICSNDYDGYNINHPKRYTYYEDDDYSLILAKL